MEDVLLSVRLVGDSQVVAEASDDVHLIRCERRLHPEGASGPAFTGEAMTHRDHKRVACYFQTKLPTVTGGLSGSHVRNVPKRRQLHGELTCV
jgi:hypothetical protein